MLRNGFYDIPDQNGDLTKLTYCLTLIGSHFRQGVVRTLYISVARTMVFFYFAI